MNVEEQIVATMRNLPPESQHEILEFAQFLRIRQEERNQPSMLASSWPAGFLEDIVGGWQGEPLVRQNETLRPFGLCSGQFQVPDDFDAPLPKDELGALK